MKTFLEHLQDNQTIRQIIESAPPDSKIEDFIKKSKDDFKQRYGDDWEDILYATAWKKYGDKKDEE